MSSKLYLTQMVRWGNPKDHAYIIQAFSQKVDAEICSAYHGKVDRGGKYECEIVEIDWEYEEGNDVIYVAEYNMNNGNFQFEVFNSKSELLTHTVEELLDFRMCKMTIQHDISDQINEDGIENYEFLLGCSGLMSEDARVHLHGLITTYRFSNR